MKKQILSPCDGLATCQCRTQPSPSVSWGAICYVVIATERKLSRKFQINKAKRGCP